MASMQEIQKKIESIGITKQIARAMQLVSNTKIRRARELLDSSRLYADECCGIIQSVIGAEDFRQGALFENTVDSSTLFIVFGSDRGLCGAYNTNICKYAVEEMRPESRPLLITVGTKIWEFFIRRNTDIKENYRGISQNPFYLDSTLIAEYALELFLNKEVGKIVLVYTHFESLLSHQPTALQLLPFDSKMERIPMALEPEGEELLEMMVPMYMQSKIFAALSEGAACEQSARVTSMDAAVKNCGDMLEKLQLEYNQARQGTITEEVNEIISGAEAL